MESTTSAAAAADLADPPLPAAGDDDPAALAERFEPAAAEELVAWALDRYAGRLALVTSLQAEGVVLLDLAHRLAGGRPGGLDGLLRVVSLDTGRLHPETYDLVDRVRERFGVEVELVFPEAAAVEALVRRAGPNLFYASPEARRECCRVRKVEPLARALAPFDAWLTGLRRGQSAARRATPKIGLDGNDRTGRRFKLAPLADWSEERVWRHVRERGLPYHPLYDQGYRSIGCAPCSRPSRPAEPARAGRWWWESDEARECGLHLVTIGVGGTRAGANGGRP